MHKHPIINGPLTAGRERGARNTKDAKISPNGDDDSTALDDSRTTASPHTEDGRLPGPNFEDVNADEEQQQQVHHNVNYLTASNADNSNAAI